MQFEWDEGKRAKTLEDRGVDILYAALIFEGKTLQRVDNREDYGETRFISLGVIDDVPYVVVHTQREEKTRLITAWKGGRKEYERYKKHLP